MNNIEKLFEVAQPFVHSGETANYIPALQQVDKELFSIAMIDASGREFELGNTSENFTLQSVSKVLNFIVACQYHGMEHVMQYVDVEPTGDKFNSIVRLESNQNKPFNPMINAGAITVASLLPGESVNEKVESVLALLKKILKRDIEVNKEVFLSEYESADYNRAIAHILNANNFLACDVEVALTAYLKLCAIEMTVMDLAKVGLYITCNEEAEQEIYRTAKALMVTCGMYNYSGRFAMEVGIPAKSGVSGCIIGCVKDGQIEQLNGPIGLAVYGPAIDPIGNSVAGVEFLKRISAAYNLSIF